MYRQNGHPHSESDEGDQVLGISQESLHAISPSSIVTSLLELLHQGVGLNTTGSVYKSNTESEFEFSGNPTAKALLSWAVLKLNMDMEQPKQSCTTIHVEPFNSEKKRSGILMKNSDNTVHVHWKGAAEMILAMCSNYYDPSGNVKTLDDIARKTCDQIIQGMAASRLRCIAFADMQVPNIMWRNLIAQALYQIAVLLILQFKGESIFLGIIGIAIVLQVVMVEFLKKFADMERLTWEQWGACLGIAALSWPLGWLVKCTCTRETIFQQCQVAKCNGHVQTISYVVNG